MKKYSSIVILFVLSLLLLSLCGCAQQNQSSSSSSKSKQVGEDASTVRSAEKDQDDKSAVSENKDTQDSKEQNSTDTNSDDKAQSAENKNQSTGDTKNNFEQTPLYDPSSIPEDKRKAYNNLTGKWQLQTQEPNGTTKVIKVKFDNVGGFTIATGTTEAQTAHVGSYSVEGDTLTASATTSGPSTGDDTYELRFDPETFEYKFQINSDLTQLVLTPVSESAKLLTGDAPITLAKA